MEKVKVTQDVLYQYLNEHDVKLSRFAEVIGISPGMVMSSFKHHKDRYGKPRSFSTKNISLLNDALPVIAGELRTRQLVFGSDQVYTNRLHSTYDPALIKQIKELGKYINITSLTGRLLGWSKNKKSAVLVQSCSKAYGCISKDDVVAINNEILAVAGVLSSYEVVADDNVNNDSNNQKRADIKDDKKPVCEKQAPNHNRTPWDDTKLGMLERCRLLHEKWPNGMLLFRVDGGYTAEGEDALYISNVDKELKPFYDSLSGLTTLFMSRDEMEHILLRLIEDGKRIAITDMH